MALTYTKIASVSVGSGGASSIDFTSIPATYTDLVVKMSARNNQANYRDTMVVTFNSNTGANYSEKLLYGDGAAGSASRSSQTSFLWIYSDGVTATSNTFSNFEVYVPNYSGSTNKSISVDGVTESNDSVNGRFIQVLNAGLWAQTAAISSISFAPSTGSFVQYSTAYLYGILKA